MLSNLEKPELVDLIPFGILSDKYGRKPFLFLYTFSIAISSGGIIAVGKICYRKVSSGAIANYPTGCFHDVFRPQSSFGLGFFFLLCGDEGVAYANMLAIIADCVHT